MAKKKKTPDTRGFATTSTPSKAAVASAAAAAADAPAPPKRKSKWYKPPPEPAPAKSIEELKAIQKQQQQRIKEEAAAAAAENAARAAAEAKQAEYDHLMRRIAVVRRRAAARLNRIEGKWGPERVDRLPVCRIDGEAEHLALEYLRRYESSDDWVDAAAGPGASGSGDARDDDADAVEDDAGGGPPTLDRLWAVYDSLVDAGFSETDVERAMEATGGLCVSSARDWLCLHLAEDALPAYVADKFYRAGGRETAIVVPAAVDESVALVESVQVQQVPARDAVAKRAVVPGDKWDGNDAAKMNSWILERATACESEEEDLSAALADGLLVNEESDGRRANGRRKKRPERKPEATAANPDDALDGIGEMLANAETFSSNAPVPEPPSLKDQTVTRKATDQTKADPTDALDGVGGMLENAETAAETAAKNAQSRPKRPSKNCPVLDLEYPNSWTGKSPKQLLNDTLARQYKQSSVKYRQLRVSGSGHACAVRAVGKTGKEIVACEMDGATTRTQTAKEAEHYAATLALYTLFHHTSMQTLLPPPYRDLWLDWKQTAVGQVESAEASDAMRRFEFVQGLLGRLLPRYKALEAARAAAAASAGKPLVTGTTSGQRGGGTSRGWTEAQFAQLWREREASGARKGLLATRRELPVYAHRQEALELINGNAVVVISGATGSGKSTQIAQFVVEEALENGVAETCRVICVQPRRISAVSLAARVSRELGEKGGQVGRVGSLVGCQVRLESQVSASTRLTFCTTGVALRRLEDDPLLADVSHVIVDEVHERTLDSDMLLALLRDVLQLRGRGSPPLRVVLMSATLNATQFCRYMAASGQVPVLDVPGKTFPVERLYLEDVIPWCGYSCDRDSEYALARGQRRRALGQVRVTGRGGASESVALDLSESDDESLVELRESGRDPDYDPALAKGGASPATLETLQRLDHRKINYDLIVAAVVRILEGGPGVRDGAVLVFLPGYAEIGRLFGLLTACNYLVQNAERVWVLPLHSVLSSEAQRDVFAVPPRGVRKVVLSTNIAETGVTIPDVAYVVDTGRAKEARYSESRNLSEFREVLVSQAACTQRCGRAGRVRAGTALCLYTRKRFESLPAFSTPEMLRLPLEAAALRVLIAAQRQGRPTTEATVHDFFGATLDAPPKATVERALANLHRAGALDARTGALSSLGYHIGHLPLDIQPAKMMLFGAVFSCLDPVLTVAAVQSLNRSVFVRQFDRDESVLRRVRARFRTDSDHRGVLLAYEAWRRVAQTQPPRVVREFCAENLIDARAMESVEELKCHFLRKLESTNFVVAGRDPAPPQRNGPVDFCPVPPSYNRRSGSPAVLQLVLAMGLYPHVAMRTDSFSEASGTRGAPGLVAALGGQRALRMRGSSFAVPRPDGPRPTSPFYVYDSIVKSNTRVYIDGISSVAAAALVFACQTVTTELAKRRLVTLDGDIHLKCWPKTASILRRLRLALMRVLARKIVQPQTDFSEQSASVIEVICALVGS